MTAIQFALSSQWGHPTFDFIKVCFHNCDKDSSFELTLFGLGISVQILKSVNEVENK